METSSYTADLRDIEFVLFEHLPFPQVIGAGPFEEVTEEDVKMVLEAGGDFASNVVAPVNARGDRIGCRFEDGKVFPPPPFEDVWKVVGEQGWIGVVAPVEMGGQSLPKVVGTALDEMIIGANPAFHTYVGLSRAAANLLMHHATEELQQTYVPRLLAGEWQGTMCLTEAEAGSDVGASRTIATPVGDGTYKIKGTKTFITAGDHQMTENHIHLVLARLPDAPSGVKGLSLFLVPKFRLNDSGECGEFNDVHCSKIEEKMGIHGSATTVLNFGDADACVGYLVGKENEGIKCMFHMMNEERIVVGLQGQALAGAAYGHAVKFAQERIQGSDITAGKTITDVKVPIVVHPDVRRMLMTTRAYAEGGRALLYYTSLQQDLADVADSPEQKGYHLGRIALLTPVCKAWGSDAGVAGCYEALQVFGGSGYVCDYPAEQYLRDAVIATIYEGTNGIQSIDLLFRKVLGGGGKLVESFNADVTSWLKENGAHSLLGREIKTLGAAAMDLGKATMHLAKGARADLALTAVSTTSYLTAFGNVVVAWLLLQQAVVAAEKLQAYAVPTEDSERRKFLEDNDSARFYASKIETARFFVHRILSQNRWKIAQIESDDRSALDICF